MFGFSSIGFAAETTTAVTATAQQPSLLESMIPMLFIFIAMYFLMIRPQTKKAKEQTDMLKQLKSGDEILTSSGIMGKVRTIADTYVILDLGGSQLKISKDHVVRIIN